MDYNLTILDNRLFVKKKLLFISLACVLLLCSTSIWASQKEHFVAVGLADAFPYSYMDEKGNAAGIYIDIAKMVSNKTGMELEIKLMEWSSAIEAIEKGTADFLLGILAEDDRNWQFAVSDPHSNIELAYFSYDQLSFPSIPYEPTMQRMNVGIYEMIADMESFIFLPATSKAMISDVDSLFLLLSQKKLNAALCPREIGTSFVKKHSLSSIKVKPYPVLTRKVCFAALKDRKDLVEKLNAGLNTVKNTREYFALISSNSPFCEHKNLDKIPIVNFVFPVIFTLILIAGYASTIFIKKTFGRSALLALFLVCISIEALFIVATYLQDRHAQKQIVHDQMKTLGNLNSMLLANRIKRVKDSMKMIETNPLLTDSSLFSLDKDVPGYQDSGDQVGGQAIFLECLRDIRRPIFGSKETLELRLKKMSTAASLSRGSLLFMVTPVRGFSPQLCSDAVLS
ncbi:transporter substrate-binding domain-containing protein [Desulfomonile tiedjei]|uniref:Periplasmic component of amino acid ABC-type transporter/signal transduction system n=1 Tax=Desulfomonile tiedjei (strain ATCC 49306 / DSM 6799 / DCB-1) TaxID=706587 RepID=I4CDU7_DESTA|nr:transporter substrate-binding domain-containing protein [Desulfomonile tiedjei]AFM27738.1 periplasmic component of amino acid ABC-type transporter/signal transduction system [Desulfomonile tiedjei DSM 6799]